MEGPAIEHWASIRAAALTQMKNLFSAGREPLEAWPYVAFAWAGLEQSKE
jgi:hypothetical protein